MNSRGKFITVEGCDGSGKHTQSCKMKEYLESKGKKVIMYSFPRYDTTIGKIIANYLKGEYGNINEVPHELICIAYAADRAAASADINEALNKGYYVISDRYTYSNLFTAAKMPEEKWLPFIQWIEDMEFNNLGVVKPDFNIYLYIDPLISIKRIEQRGKRDYQEGKEDIHENNKKLLINTAKCYLDFANYSKNWFVIDQMENDTQLPPNKVFEKIEKILDNIIE